MAAAGVVSYKLLEVVDFEPGAWCPACALPSAFTITLASIVQTGGKVGPLRLSTGTRCSTHGWISTKSGGGERGGQ